MSSELQNSPSNTPQKTGTVIALVLIWALTLLVTQTAIWLTARIFDHSNAVENDLTWGQSGLLSFIWVFTKTWHKALSPGRQQQ